MPIPAIVVGGAKLLGSLLLWEGVASLIEHWTGNPEESVQAALQAAQQNAASSALWEQNRPGIVEEGVAKTFQGIDPGRSLTELAMLQQGMFDKADPARYPVLNYVSQKTGIHPSEFMQRTAPSRIGDFSGVQRMTPGMSERLPNGQ